MKAITRTAAGVTAAAIAVTTSIAAVNADNDKYTKPYTIANVLTDYQFFVEGDFEHGGHTVGAVAIGGNAKIGAFGDGQVAPSYIHHIESVGNFSDCTWVDEAHKAHTVYYGESDIGERTNFVKNDDFIDFTEAMSRIRKESQWIADNGTKIGEDCYDVSSDTITVDLKANSSKSYTIDYSLFSKAKTLNFTGLTVEEFAKGGYTLSVVGVNGNVGIDFTSWGSMGTHISLNGQGMDGKLKDISGGYNNGQYNPNGTPLLYNFPDATSLDINYLAGGLCAPNATVSLNGGNYEGNIIAKNIAQTNAEAHFFSYYPITEQGDTKYPEIDGGDPADSSTTTTTTTVSSSAPVSSDTTTTSKSETTTTTTTTAASSKPDTDTTTTADDVDITTTTTTTAKRDPVTSDTTTTSKSNTTTTTTTSKSNTTTTTTKPATSATTTTSKSNTTTTTSKSETTTTTTSKTGTTTTTTTTASSSEPVSSDTTTTSKTTTTTAKTADPDETTTTTSAVSGVTGTSDSGDTTTTTDGMEVSTTTSGDPVETSSTGESSSVSSTSVSTVSGTDGTASTTTKKTSDSSGTSTTTKKTSSSGANTAKAVDAASASNPKTGAAATTAAAVLLAAASVIAASKKNKD